ncbi:MAG: hypothetical protein RI886_1112 [Pseudomonadota bacterium]
MSEKRKYTKKSNYWKKFDSDSGPQMFQSNASFESLPVAVNQSFARTSTSTTSRTKNHNLSKTLIEDRYSNIRSGILPYENTADGINVRDSILLCQKAYANIALFRNVIDMMAEFSNSEILLEGGSRRSRNFYYKWLKKISAWNLTDQYFREYFRGGNVFLYRIDGRFTQEDYNKMTRSTAAENEIPVKYVVLNPYEIVALHSSYYNMRTYEKFLSQYDIENLRNPKTEEDKKIFQSLSPETRKRIKDGAYNRDGLTMPLDSKKLYYSFYKKQDYEPFAIPFGFPVLADLNMKQEFKNLDAAILRTVENVILMITTGTEPEKGGVNPKNIQALQSIFTNESLGRVLVADYTTKAEFIVPDLRRVLGPEKYEIINQDIKDGLQNIMLTNDSHSTTDIKSNVFLDRLKEARSQFLNDFLQKEMDRIGRNLGFKQIPRAIFKEVDMKDDIQLMRIATRLMEIGVLTPEQGMRFMKNGQLPNEAEIAEEQEEFISRRKKGYFNPLVGGVPMLESEMGDAPTKVPMQRGRPIGATTTVATASINGLKKSIAKINDLYSEVEKQLKKNFKLRKLNAEQNDVIGDICERIICSKDMEDWISTANTCLDNAEELDKLSVKPEIEQIAEEYEINNYSAAIIYHG